MATIQGVSGINLLPKDSFEFSAVGKTLKWTITIGRVLVVLTEFVVLLAFASRFYFDRKLSDLGDQLIQKEAQINAYASVETQMRKVLAKQAPVEKILAGGVNFASKINGLTQVLPTGTVLDTLTLDQKSMSLTGTSQSEFGFAQFVNGIKKMPGITMVSLGDTSFDQTTGGVKFSIQINF